MMLVPVSRWLWMKGLGSVSLPIADITPRPSTGRYMTNTPITAGSRLSSSSIASPGFVVTRLRNMSTAMMFLPKR